MQNRLDKRESDRDQNILEKADKITGKIDQI